jgi:hypothetical protein
MVANKIGGHGRVQKKPHPYRSSGTDGANSLQLLFNVFCVFGNKITCTHLHFTWAKAG